ncbi:superoxide dismutase family protein [Alkalibaculum sp. M08DMB]|uniref:Superoxide dismutase family protein n=1 Tax=Alkalibaculum sporogenes TaxID=2655001 RepID=A0A6A7KBI1_9FIRM|nr:superoxide dismutase family protein [Alkalibaculum sporogenes]MPW26705.1 superoxide dismutase family protein [Alkalibaculum sporogenes]
MNSNKQYQNAIAYVTGGPLATSIQGTVIFRETTNGVVVCVSIVGLPDYQPSVGDQPPIGPHGFHIHEHGSCAIGDANDPFQNAGEHWNPDGQPHGNHAGDFPVLFSNNGISRKCFFTNRFKVSEIINKSIIIHENPDDFRSQPSGAAGKRLACGIIQPQYTY